MIDRLFRRLGLAVAILPALVLGTCDDNDLAGPDDQVRMYNQLQRLGNPLVSEVFLAKRNHALHGGIGPAEDVANLSAEVKAFVTTVAGRKPSVANTLAAVLLPDMLVVQTDKASTTAGWLSWALADGWGGRRLTDDVVDAGLMAIFGPLLDPDNVSPGLTTDNVANDSQFLPTFPYLGTRN